ncbi:MAG: hypothetical protein AAF747_02485 [Planctomycetota bacterium]
MAADKPRLSDDTRYALAEAAAASERSARSRAGVYFAAVLVIVSAIALAFAISQRAAAADDLDAEVRRGDRIATLIAELRELERVNDGAETARDPGLLTKIIDASNRAGIDIGSPDEAPPRAETAELTKRRVTYRFSTRDLEAVLGWTRLCMTQVPGLVVESIELSPRGTEWSIVVAFARWERTESA